MNVLPMNCPAESQFSWNQVGDGQPGSMLRCCESAGNDDLSGVASPFRGSSRTLPILLADQPKRYTTPTKLFHRRRQTRGQELLRRGPSEQTTKPGPQDESRPRQSGSS